MRPVIRPATATLVAALGLSAALALPTPAGADTTGGTAAPTPGTPTAASGSSAPTPGSTLRAATAALAGRWQRATGTLAGAGAGSAVLLQRTDGRSGWTTVAQARAGRGGAFAVSWRPNQVGRQTLRAVSPTGSTAARSAASSPTVPLTVYASAIATQFGPGFYNQRTACGVVLTPRTVGVAHTTLPCGTLVEFYYRGRTIRAPVIDRGPYANNATWDLTTGAAVALRFDGYGYVGSLRVGRVSLSRAG